MPLSCTWLDDDETLLYLRLEGKLNAADFLAADSPISALLDNATRPVAIIIDYTMQVYFSPEYMATTGQLQGMDHANIEAVVFVGNRLAWELFDVYASQYKEVRFPYEYAPTLDNARDYIRRLRARQSRRTAYRPGSPELN